MLFYFSATGNCLHVARNLDDNPLSIAQELKKDERVYQDETMGLVSPIYGGELPTIVQDFIATSTFQTDYFYVVLTYGNLDTAAAEWTYYFAKSHRVNIDYIGTIKMVDNYLPAFDMNEQMAMDKHEDEQIRQVKANILARVALIPHPDEKARKLYDMASRRPVEVNNGSQITVRTERCVGCGICTKVCPVGNFYIKDGKASRYQETCVFCQA